MMSVYETSLILSDVFPGISDLTLQDWTFGMCKCAVNFLPLGISSPEVLSASPNLSEETAMMPESCSEVPDDSQKLFCLWGHSIMAEISAVNNFGLQV